MEEILRKIIEECLQNIPKESHHYKPVMNVKDLSEYLQVSISWIHKNKEHIPHFKIGSDYRFNIEQIDEWRLAQKEVKQERKVKISIAKEVKK